MKFHYSTSILDSGDGGDFLLLRRPEVKISIAGPRDSMIVEALVDTGADYTIFPKRIAESLGIRLSEDALVATKSISGNRMQLLFGEVQLRIADESEEICFDVEAGFYDFNDLDSETIVLGHAGFLEYFVATFDGEESTLELAPSHHLTAIQERRN